MEPIATAVKYKHNPSKRWTIQQCLINLGAPFREVYVSDEKEADRCPTCHKPMRKRVIWRKAIGTIYQRFSRDELGDWVEELWKKAAQWHPDRHLNQVEFYTQKFQDASEAYGRAKKILSWHGT